MHFCIFSAPARQVVEEGVGRALRVHAGDGGADDRAELQAAAREGVQLRGRPVPRRLGEPQRIRQHLRGRGRRAVEEESAGWKRKLRGEQAAGR